MKIRSLITDIERLAPWLCYLDDGLSPDGPRIAWLPYALEHTAFFYATLLTAAVHLNRRRKLRDLSALYWFKVQTIKYANENMNIPDKVATDEMVMVALILLYFNVSARRPKQSLILADKPRLVERILKNMRSISKEYTRCSKSEEGPRIWV